MILRPARHVGLMSLVALLLLLTGAAIWLGARTPDPKSCVSMVARSVQDPESVGKAAIRAACRRANGS